MYVTVCLLFYIMGSCRYFFLFAQGACLRALVPGTTERVHGHGGDSQSNCSLNVSAASLDFLQTGQETFCLLFFTQTVSSCYEPAVSILNHLLSINSESPPLFAQHRALCSCMLYLSIQRLSGIYIFHIKDNLNYRDRKCHRYPVTAVNITLSYNLT